MINIPGVSLNVAQMVFSYLSGFRLRPRPTIMHLEITYRCNCRCTFCDRWKIGPRLAKKELSLKELLNLVMQAKKLGIKALAFSGGEPFIRPETIRLSEFAKRMGMFTLVNTNGTLINERNVKEIVRNFDQIIISIDSLNPKIHDKLRGVKNTHYNAFKAIKLLTKNGKSLGQIAVQTVLSPENYSEIANIFSFFRKLCIPVYVQPVHNFTESLYAAAEHQWKKTDTKEMRKTIENLTTDLKFPQELHNIGYKVIYGGYFKKIPEFLNDPLTLINDFICFAGSFSFFVDPLGEVYPCDGIRVAQGNVREKPLVKIWEDMQEIRKKISGKDRRCVCWFLCTAPIFRAISHPLKRLLPERAEICSM